jgi:hypothetical protein
LDPEAEKTFSSFFHLCLRENTFLAVAQTSTPHKSVQAKVKLLQKSEVSKNNDIEEKLMILGATKFQLFDYTCEQIK